MRRKNLLKIAVVTVMLTTTICMTACEKKNTEKEDITKAVVEDTTKQEEKKTEKATEIESTEVATEEDTTEEAIVAEEEISVDIVIETPDITDKSEEIPVENITDEPVINEPQEEMVHVHFEHYGTDYYFPKSVYDQYIKAFVTDPIDGIVSDETMCWELRWDNLVPTSDSRIFFVPVHTIDYGWEQYAAGTRQASGYVVFNESMEYLTGFWTGAANSQEQIDKAVKRIQDSNYKY